MKKLFWILVLATGCASTARAPRVPAASAGRSFHCNGVYDDNTGAELTLVLNGDSFTADGTVNEGEGFKPEVFCNGDRIKGKQSTRYLHFATSAECTADALTVMKSLLAEGNGLVALVKRGGGKAAGGGLYSYRYYRCERE